MSTTWQADGLMTAQSQNIDRYKRNFLRQAVCELRFPTLMELGEARPPAAFVNALRKDYPYLESGNEVTVGIGVGAVTSNSHIFRSSKMNWTVSLKQNAIAIETTAYTEYSQMRDRVKKIIDAASKIIDSDFFTRIGLRYINVIDKAEDPVNGWVNPLLVGPLSAKVFKSVSEYAGRLQFQVEDGGCLLQHLIQLKKDKSGELQAEYVIDVDAYRNEVDILTAVDAVDALHKQAFDVFDWCLGAEARSYLSSAK